MTLYDTHIHLYAEEFQQDRVQLIDQAMHHGIKRFYLPNIDSESINGMLHLEEQYPGICIPMMGLHPCSVKENYQDELKLVCDWWEKRKFIAVGEIGMDLYWDKTFVKEQEIAFRLQIELALKYQAPIIIHCRDAFDEIFAVLDSMEKLPHGIFHCFTGTTEQAHKIISYGKFKLGIGGVLTYKNSGLDRVIEQTALEHLVLETDAPYLPPTPHRGKRNEPGFLLIVAQKLAQIKKITLDELAQITTKNAEEVFGNHSIL